MLPTELMVVAYDSKGGNDEVIGVTSVKIEVAGERGDQREWFDLRPVYVHHNTSSLLIHFLLIQLVFFRLQFACQLVFLQNNNNSTFLRPTTIVNKVKNPKVKSSSLFALATIQIPWLK